MRHSGVRSTVTHAKTLLKLTIAGVFSSVLYGQLAFVGAGYENPGPAGFSAAPGQVITIFVSGLGDKVTQKVSAEATPLPITIAGISVTMRQSSHPSGPFPVPLLTVFPVYTCGVPAPPPCWRLLGITLQVPFELIYNYTPTNIPNVADLVVTDGAVTGVVLLIPLPVRPHLVSIPGTTVPLVTHADGSLVSSGKAAGGGSPAKVGEELVTYAFGLGPTTPPVKTGDASPSPAATTRPFYLSFDYRPNAIPYVPVITPEFDVLPSSVILAKSLFAGLVSGFTGLYQINFQVPAPTGTLDACSDLIESNLTVTIIGVSGGVFPGKIADGAGICVQPPDTPSQ